MAHQPRRPLQLLAPCLLTLALGAACGETDAPNAQRQPSQACRSATVLASGGLNVRQAARATAQQIGRLPAGTVVCVLETLEGGSYLTDSGSARAWARIQGGFGYSDQGQWHALSRGYIAAPAAWLALADHGADSSGEPTDATFSPCHGFHPSQTLPPAERALHSFRLLEPGQDYAAGDYLVAVNVFQGLPRSYLPQDLTWIPASLLEGGAAVAGNYDLRLRRRALGALLAWSEHTRQSCPAGIRVTVKSAGGNVNTAYRSWSTQCWLRELYDGVSYTRAAYPGFSEHHLGTTVDVTNYNASCVAQSAWQFGFIRSYPEGTEGYHHYMTEGWHYRYVGRAAATYHHNLEQSRGPVSSHELLDILEQSGLRRSYEQRIAQDAGFDQLLACDRPYCIPESQIGVGDRACNPAHPNLSFECINPCGDAAAWLGSDRMWRGIDCPNGCNIVTGDCS